MAEGNWQCGMCAAYNEPSKNVCMVCETFRELGTRGAEPGSGDLLAPTQDMFGGLPEEPVAARPAEAEDELPPVRVMEPPPTRPGGARVPEPETVPAVEPQRASERVPEGWTEAAVTEPVSRAVTEPVMGWWEWQAEADTEPVPVPVGTGPEPGAGVTEPLPTVSGRAGTAHRLSGRWTPPRWPQGSVRALALAAVGGVVLVLAWVLPGSEEEASGPGDGEQRDRECPERIAAHVPGTDQGVLVDAFETERHRIVLCDNGAGELYYFGEFLDGNGEVMVVPAERTDEGYVADAGQTRYEIGRGEVVITGGDGAEIARLPLEPVPDPE
ncbi:zinc finger Ran-binding domain-containing protein [Nocardiopsis valliformis]|uniref:zinc finger Ran-binding domain-containing protein n=1 Tax=Nocardiopsis valliformis TaxID=239974 RepID=UPI00034982A0|nr:Ran-binding zinc finger domain-containing protein [Nocardiopsis valliformis]